MAPLNPKADITMLRNLFTFVLTTVLFVALLLASGARAQSIAPSFQTRPTPADWHPALLPETNHAHRAEHPAVTPVRPETVWLRLPASQRRDAGETPIRT